MGPKQAIPECNEITQILVVMLLVGAVMDVVIPRRNKDPFQPTVPQGVFRCIQSTFK